MSKVSSFVPVVLTLLLSFVVTRSQLRTDFYSITCPRLERIVRAVVSKAIQKEMRMAASLLRLQYSDCFVNGCDGSVLLDSKDGEKLVLPNLNSLRGFEVIDDIKTAVEKECKGIVSCADIVAIAARDSVLLSGGNKWKVLLGRRDGLVANQSGAKLLPSPFDSLDAIIDKFAIVGLNVSDVVALSGAHTIGRSSCSLFNERTSNFSGTGKPDPTLNPALIPDVQKECSANVDGNNLVALDLKSKDLFDNIYFSGLVNSRGVMQSDQVLYYGDSGLSATTKSIVQMYSKNNVAFLSDFANSMIKMGNVGVLTGEKGTIRKNCRVA